MSETPQPDSGGNPMVRNILLVVGGIFVVIVIIFMVHVYGRFDDLERKQAANQEVVAKRIAEFNSQNQASLTALAQRLGIPTPKTFFPRSTREVAAFAEAAPYPIMLKPVEASRARNRAAAAKSIELGTSAMLSWILWTASRKLRSLTSTILTMPFSLASSRNR